MTRNKTSCSCVGLIGLVKQLANEALAKSGLSERTPIDVNNTSGIIIALGILRISVASISPSIPGICMSRIARSKVSPVFKKSKACAAL